MCVIGLIWLYSVFRLIYNGLESFVFFLLGSCGERFNVVLYLCIVLVVFFALN